MEKNNWSFNSLQHQSTVDTSSLSKTFIAGVFSWMGVALAISAVTAYVFGTDAAYQSYLYDAAIGKTTMLGYGVMFAPLAFVLIMSFGMQKLSSMVLTGLFLTFSVLMGMSFSFIFMQYQMASVVQIFGVTSGMFGFMAVVGYTTKTDLTKLGSILMMALVGIIIASIINIFMGSGTMSYIISFISVIVFTGLTAYDVQKLKEIGSTSEAGTESNAKMSIMGALTLYLDFINLFLALLRLFGSRK